ncbi:MAG TPA: hypothetical protein VFV47_04395 [Hyphomicrobiaceae bacterium]|nr:hypothetical protein [Hyphomicrobiaceae bacterium]
MRLSVHLRGLLAAAVLTLAAAPAGASGFLRDGLVTALGIEMPAARKSLPSEPEQARLVNEVIELFIQSVEVRSMAALHQHAAEVLQAEIRTEQLDQTFRPFFIAVEPGDIDLEALQPVITEPARLVSNEAFTIEGHYTTLPQRLSFRLTFVREGFDWRWSFIHVALDAPAGQPGM